MKKYNVRTIPRAFLALALLAVPSLLQAQTGNVTGAITDAGTLAPLEAVQVSIVGQGTGGSTNAEGRYLVAGSAGRRGDDPGRTPGLHHSDRAGHDQLRRRGRGRLRSSQSEASAA